MKRRIKNFFERNPRTAFKAKAISKLFKIKNEEQYNLLKITLHKLLEEKYLSKKGKRYQLNTMPDTNKLFGTLQLHKDGYGFVTSNKKNLGDVYVAERNIGPAFDGDTVEVVVFAKQKGKNFEGQIIKVIERKRNEIIGTLHKSKSFYFVNPADYRIHRDIYIDKINLKNAKENDKVIVGNIDWEKSMLNPEGVIIETAVLEMSSGQAASQGVEVDQEFLREVESIPDKLAFKIGDVASLVSLKQYVLRYWETEFDELRPKKSKNNQRVYSRKDVETVMLIKKLLHRDRFSIEGGGEAVADQGNIKCIPLANRLVGIHFGQGPGSYFRNMMSMKRP